MLERIECYIDCLWKHRYLALLGFFGLIFLLGLLRWACLCSSVLVETSVAEVFGWSILRLFEPVDESNWANADSHLGWIFSAVIGLMGAFMFAVITGLLASIFYHRIRHYDNEERIKDVSKRLKNAFHPIRCPHTEWYVTPRYKSIATLQALLRYDTKDIIEAVDREKSFRLSNLADTYSVSKNSHDKLIVEPIPADGVMKKYGYYNDVGSNVTIISTSSVKEPGTAHFAYLLARLGKFNYISKEYSESPENPESFYNVSSKRWKEYISETDSYFSEFMKDLKNLCHGADKWVIFILGTTRGNPDTIYFCDDRSNEDANLRTILNQTGSRLATILFNVNKALMAMTSETIQARSADYPQISASINCELFRPSGKTIAHYLRSETNVKNLFTIRIPFQISARDNRHIIVAWTLAKEIHDAIFDNQLPKPDKGYKIELLKNNYH